MQPPKWPDAPPCVNKIAGDEVRANLEEIVDKFGKHDAGAPRTELVRETCDKQIYRRDGSRIVLFSVPPSLAFRYAGVFAVMVRGYAEPDHGELTQARAAACLARAQSDLVAIGVGADALNDYRKKFEALADDPDVGAAHYLNCSDTGEPSYQESLSIMVHELTHQNTAGNCLYTSYGPLCFALSSDLPSSSIATVEELFDSDDPYLKKLNKAQQLYLVQFNKQNRGPAALFNELNAYTAGLEVSAALLKKDGPKGLLDKEGKPEAQMLPLVMLWTAKYLSELQDENPDLYASTFGPATGNHKSVETLLAHGEAAYQRWTTELDRHHLAASQPEHQIWLLYLEAKKHDIPRT